MVHEFETLQNPAKRACFAYVTLMTSLTIPVQCRDGKWNSMCSNTINILIEWFPGSSAWVEKNEPGTHCLRMLSSPLDFGCN